MGFRYRKTFRIAPGIWLNIAKEGVSLSLGKKGYTINIGKSGTRTTVGLPGSGLSHNTYVPYSKRPTFFYIILFVIIAGVVLAGVFAK